MRKFLRRYFYTRYDLLAVLEFNRWYYGLDIQTEYDFSLLGNMHGKLFRLVDEKFLEWEEGDHVLVERDGELYSYARAKFRRTGKMIPVKKKKREFKLFPANLQPQG